MLGSAVSSSTPNDFQPNSHKGVEADAQISRQAMPAPPGMAYAAVGMHRALDSAIGLPSRSTSALWTLLGAPNISTVASVDYEGHMPCPRQT
jgi:hypothetical protein